jgi:hypothetical protein
VLKLADVYDTDEYNMIPATATKNTMNDGDSHTGLVRGAKAATDDEKNMTLLQGIRLYPKAIAWSVLISTCIAMEGYDLCLLGNFCESRIVFICDLEALMGSHTTRRVPAVQAQVRKSYERRIIPSLRAMAGWTIERM